MPHRSDFGTPCCLRPTEAGSALGSTPFEATFTFTVVTARQLVVSPRETLSIGFRILISLHPAIQTTGRLTFAPAGLPPAEHTSLNWTHFRTAGFPRYGWKAGFQMGPSRLPRELKSAPDIRGALASLHPYTSWSNTYPAQCRVVDSIVHRHEVDYHFPRGPRSCSSYVVSSRHHLIDPIRPTCGHIAISLHGSLYAMSSLCGSA